VKPIAKKRGMMIIDDITMRPTPRAADYSTCYKNDPNVSFENISVKINIAL
jgi:hypothetical protein